METQKQAYTYAIIAVLFWSTIASVFKVSLRYMDFLQLLLFSSFVAILVLFLILLGQNKLGLLKTYSKSDYLRSALLGILNPFVYYVILLKAYSLLRAQEAQPLNYTWQIMLVLLSIPLLKQKIKLLSILAIFISFFGVFVISTQGDVLSFRFTHLGGALLALGSAVIWALFWIYNLRDKRDAVAKLFLNFCFGFVFILVTTSLFSEIVIPETAGIVGVIYVGIFELGLTFVIWLKALSLSRTTAQVSNLIYLAPFVSLIFIHLIVGEEILLSTITGLILIVAGIGLQQYTSRLYPPLKSGENLKSS